MRAEHSLILSSFSSGLAFALSISYWLGAPLGLVSTPLTLNTSLLLVFFVALNTYLAYRSNSTEDRAIGILLVSLIALLSSFYPQQGFFSVALSIYSSSLAVLFALELEGKISLGKSRKR